MENIQALCIFVAFVAFEAMYEFIDNLPENQKPIF
jgi:hypothetical protein